VRFISGHNAGFKPGNTVGLRHGGCGTPEYGAYTGAKYRCTNPRAASWPDYGGRGIKFLFARFEDFVACLGPRPEGLTLDRINNDGHYEPGNVRWASPSENTRNSRPKRPRRRSK